MTIISFSVLLLFFSILAGLLGALTGLGGGVVIIPVLVLLFHIDIHHAMGASLISVIATSSGTTSAYLRDGHVNMRIGMLLEVGAVIGAFIGALLIPFVPTNLLAIIFSLILFISAYLTIKRQEEHEALSSPHPWATALKLDGTSFVNNHLKPYHVQRVPLGLFLMGIGGMLSGLLGIGSGTLKVLAMDQVLRLPYKVATTTSNFMIGLTAAVSAGIYFTHGYIQPTICFPVMLGVIVGSLLGAKKLVHMQTKTLRIIFSIVICFIGLQMLYNTIMGNM